MKVVFVLFVAMAVLEISFALKCKVGESRGKDEFYQDLPCVPGADTCYVAKVTKNDNVIYSASCYEGVLKIMLVIKSTPIIKSRGILLILQMSAAAKEIIELNKPEHCNMFVFFCNTK